MEALIVVDMQNSFAADGGVIFVKQAREQIPYIEKVVQAFKSNETPVIYLGVAHDNASTIPTGLTITMPEFVSKWDDRGGLKRGSEDHWVEKKGFDGFHDTEPDTLLRRLDRRAFLGNIEAFVGHVK